MLLLSQHFVGGGERGVQGHPQAGLCTDSASRQKSRDWEGGLVGTLFALQAQRHEFDPRTLLKKSRTGEVERACSLRLTGQSAQPAGQCTSSSKQSYSVPGKDAQPAPLAQRGTITYPRSQSKCVSCYASWFLYCVCHIVQNSGCALAREEPFLAL